MLIFEFCEFQECEAQNEASRAKLYMRISDAEVGVVAVHNLAGLLEDEVGCERWEVKWEMTGVDVSPTPKLV